MNGLTYEVRGCDCPRMLVKGPMIAAINRRRLNSGSLIRFIFTMIIACLGVSYFLIGCNVELK
jgi:hypothetical protein